MIYTAQYRYPGRDRLDITVKGNDPADKLYAPTWALAKHPLERNKKMNNEIAIKNGKIMIGEIVFPLYEKYTAKMVCSLVIEKNIQKGTIKVNSFIYDHSLKDSYTIAGDILGVSCKAAARILNAIIWREFINPNRKYIDRWLRASGGKIMFYNFNRVVKAKPLLESYEKDGLINIQGLGLLFNSSPKQLKQMFGKGEWKKLSNNSKTRNDMIVSKILHCGLMEDLNNAIKDVKLLNTIPSTMLRRTNSIDINYLLRMRKEVHEAVSISKIKEESGQTLKNLQIHDILRTYQIVNDLMFVFNRRVSNKMTIRNMVRLHDRLSRHAVYSKEENLKESITWLDAIPTEIKFDEGTAIVLKTKYDIIQVGQQMSHCVGGYCNYVWTGDYIVVDLYTNIEYDVFRSTLGLIKNIETGLLFELGEVGFIIDQHYGKRNRIVTEEEKTLAKKVVKIVNDKLGKGGNK